MPFFQVRPEFETAPDQLTIGREGPTERVELFLRRQAIPGKEEARKIRCLEARKNTAEGGGEQILAFSHSWQQGGTPEPLHCMNIGVCGRQGHFRTKII